jgi:hypothetical protein
MPIELAIIRDADGRRMAGVEAIESDLSIRLAVIDAKWESVLKSPELSPIGLDGDDVLRVITDDPAPAEQGTDDLERRVHDLSDGSLSVQYDRAGLDAYKQAECDLNLESAREIATRL